MQVDLSEEGLQHWEDIVSLVFAYLRMLRSGGVPEYVFQELQQLSSINFDYAEKAEVSDYVSGVVANMQEHPSPKDYLAGGKIFRPEPCKLLLREFIDSLLQSIEPLPIGQSEGVRTTVCRVTLAAKRFEEDYKSQLQSSPYYGTQYVASQVNERTLRKWAGERGLSELHLPAPNPFIPSEFSIVASSADSTIVKPSEAGIGPDLIRRDEKWTLWVIVCYYFMLIYFTFSCVFDVQIYHTIFQFSSSWTVSSSNRKWSWWCRWPFRCRCSRTRGGTTDSGHSSW